MLALALIFTPGICLPIVTSEPAVTDQDHSSSTEEEEAELKVLSVQHYEPQNDFPVAMSKKKPKALAPAPEDPTTKVPSMLATISLYNIGGSTFNVRLRVEMGEGRAAWVIQVFHHP